MERNVSSQWTKYTIMIMTSKPLDGRSIIESNVIDFHGLSRIGMLYSNHMVDVVDFDGIRTVDRRER